ncbi:hypothetical protein [Streptomyces sp. NPDC006997]|uniref:hypothetical protein n=1 Tax=Streptomyces sp. NPDC006997 TaxID=3155356 RepID=UPI0033F60BA1
MGRFGAVLGPWPGGQPLAAHKGDRCFTAFALAGVVSVVFIGSAAPRASRQRAGQDAGQHPVTAGWTP